MERLILLTLNVLLSRIPCSMTQQTPIDSCNLVTSTLNNLSINVGRLGESFISVRNLAEQIQQKMQLQSVQLQSVHHGNQQHINPQQGNQVPQSGILNGQLQGGQILQNNQLNPFGQQPGTVQHQQSGLSPILSGNNGLHPQNGLNNGQSGNGNMQLGGQPNQIYQPGNVQQQLGQSPAYPGNVGVQHQNGQSPMLPGNIGLHLQNGLNNGQSGNANMQLGGQPNQIYQPGNVQQQPGQSPAYPGNVGVQPHIIPHNAQLQQIPSAPGSGGTAQNIQLQQSPATLIPGSRGTLQNQASLRNLVSGNSPGGSQPPTAGGTIMVNPSGSQINPQAGGMLNGMVQVQQSPGMVNGRFIGPSGKVQYQGGYTVDPLPESERKNLTGKIYIKQVTEELIRQQFKLSATTRICTSSGYMYGYSIDDTSCIDETVRSPSYYCYYHYNCCNRYRCMKFDDDTLARCCFDATFFQQGHFDYCNDDSHCNTAIGFKCHQKTYTCIHEYLLT